MSTDLQIDIGIDDDLVSELTARLVGATADTPAGYEVVRLGIRECVLLRFKAKQKHLHYCRAIDDELHRISNLLWTLEAALRLKKDSVDLDRENSNTKE